MREFKDKDWIEDVTAPAGSKAIKAKMVPRFKYQPNSEKEISKLAKEVSLQQTLAEIIVNECRCDR